MANNDITIINMEGRGVCTDNTNVMITKVNSNIIEFKLPLLIMSKPECNDLFSIMMIMSHGISGLSQIYCEMEESSNKIAEIKRIADCVLKQKQ